jgi:hypothetical protein
MGDEISSGQKLGIIYAGHELDKNFFATLAFCDSRRDEYIGKKWLWRVPAMLEQNSHNCPLAVVEVPIFLRWLFDRVKCLYIPSWVYAETDLSLERSSLFRNKNTSLKSDLSKIRKDKFNFEVTNELSKLDDFYHNMHVPHITKAHGNRAAIASYEFVKQRFGHGRPYRTLLLVKKENESVAGVLLVYNKNTAELRSLGVRDGSLDYVKHGAIGALFYFSVRYLAEIGFSRIGFGESRPFLRDGVLRYKKKWKPTISNRKMMGFAVKMLSETEGVKGFLSNNPFIYQDAEGLSGAIFVTSDQCFSKGDFAWVYRQYHFRGLSKLVIHRFGNSAGEIRDTIPPEFSDCMAVCSAESRF